MNTKETEKTTKEDIKPNIAPELFETWKLLRQNGDVNLMVKEFGISRPVIDNALLRGYVIKEGLVEQINNYFENRINNQKAAAARLLNLFQGEKKKA